MQIMRFRLFQLNQLLSGILRLAFVGCALVHSDLGLCKSVTIIDFCALKEARSIYNQKRIQVTAFVSHGFEDFTLFDPKCDDLNTIWLEYGGRKSSDTVFCCGPTANQTRPRSLVIEGIRIPLYKDKKFRLFDQIIKGSEDTTIHATIEGRFFSGEQVQYPGGLYWSGYGHMGCCSLLVIEKIASVDIPREPMWITVQHLTFRIWRGMDASRENRLQKVSSKRQFKPNPRLSKEHRSGSFPIQSALPPKH